MNRAVIKSLIFVAVFFILNLLIGAFLELPKKELIRMKKYDPYWRWQEFYALPEHSLNLVFLGSSHCYRSFDPRIFDAALGIKSFNMGSSSQTPLTSYYVLKEILLSQKPKYLVYEAYWRTFVITDQFTNATYNIEQMRSWNNRLELMRHAYTPKDYFNILLPAFRYKGNVQDSLRFIFGKTIHFEREDIYAGQGYMASSKIVSEKSLKKSNMFEGYEFKETDIKEMHMDSLRQIIKLCKEQGIELIFVTAPLPPTSLGMIKNYPEVFAFFNRIAEDNNIKYIDYNVLDSYQRLFTDKDFKDDSHLNASGVQKLNADLIEKFRGLGMGAH